MIVTKIFVTQYLNSLVELFARRNQHWKNVKTHFLLFLGIRPDLGNLCSKLVKNSCDFCKIAAIII